MHPSVLPSTLKPKISALQQTLLDHTHTTHEPAMPPRSSQSGRRPITAANNQRGRNRVHHNGHGSRATVIAESRRRRAEEIQSRRQRYQMRQQDERKEAAEHMELPRGAAEQRDRDADFRVDISGALNDAVRTAQFIPLRVFNRGLDDYFDRFRDYFFALMRRQFNEGTAFKVSLEIFADFYQLSDQDRSAREIPFTTSQFTVETNAQIAEAYADFTVDLARDLDDFVSNGSNWVLLSVSDAVVRLSEYSRNDAVEGHGNRPVPRGRAHMELPKWILNKKACINIQNDDDRCFLYAMSAAYADKIGALPQSHAERPYKYEKYFSQFNIDGIDMPFRITSEDGKKNFAERFERQNAHLNVALRILVADPEDKYFTIAYHSKPKKKEDAKEKWFVCLLLVGTSQYEDSHYVYVKNPDVLLSRREFNGNNALHHCLNCLKGFRLKSALEKHQVDMQCDDNAECRNEFPRDEKAYFCFRKYSARIKTDWIVYADFECILKATDDPKHERRTQTHVPCGFTSTLICTFDASLNVYDLPTRASEETTGEKLGAMLLDRLVEYKAIIERTDVERSYPMSLSPADEIDYQYAKKCHVCRGSFDNYCIRLWEAYTEKDHMASNCTKVRDHDHRKPGYNYRGAAHQWCNLQLRGMTRKKWNNKKKKRQDDEEDTDEDDDDEEEEAGWQKSDFNCKVPVVFHNLKGYDGHILMKSLTSRHVPNDDIYFIPQQGEKFMSMSFNGFQFIDSNAFLQSSLDKLVGLLTIKKDKSKDLSRLTHTRQGVEKICRHFGVDFTPELFELIAQKGIYPYEYMNSFDRFAETELPPIKSFYSTLNDEEISADEYAHAQRVFAEFHCRDLGQYHDLYLMLDVVLLSDVFENFRDTTMADIGLDPARFVSLPSLSKESGLFSHPNIIVDGIERPFEVKLFDDKEAHMDMYLFAEKAIRGGVSMIPGRYAVVKLGESVIVYVDANNLYGWAMSQAMPVGDYRWLTGWEIAMLSIVANIMQIADDGDIGYFFEVDLEIPEEHHDKFRDYPLAPTPDVVSLDELSPFSKSQYKELNADPDVKTKKLLCTLYKKLSYPIHYRNLKLYLSLGAKLTHVHRVLQFRQEKWIKPFVDEQTRKRAEAAREGNDFKKNYHKLQANSFYGKTIQNDRNFRNVNIVTSRMRQLKLARDPFYMGFQIVNPECILVERRKKKVTLDKPKLVGATILEMSKLRMYDFYYNVMKPVFGSRMQLLMTDTDSLIMKITTSDWRKEVTDHGFLSEFDFSNYPKDNAFLATLTDEQRKVVTQDNNALVGKFKDEMAAKEPLSFVGLRSKMYAIKMPTVVCKCVPAECTHKDTKKAKGVRAHIVKNKLSFEQYEQCLRGDLVVPRVKMLGFASHDQVIYTEYVDKTTLSAADTKLYLCDDKVSTYPYGHKDIRALMNDVQ